MVSCSNGPNRTKCTDFSSGTKLFAGPWQIHHVCISILKMKRVTGVSYAWNTKYLPLHVLSLTIYNSATRQDGSGTTDGWQAHKVCIRKGYQNSTKDLCDADTYPQPLYEDDFTAASAVELLRRRNKTQPFFLHVSFPGPHPPFSITGSTWLRARCHVDVCVPLCVSAIAIVHASVQLHMYAFA